MFETTGEILHFCAGAFCGGVGVVVVLVWFAFRRPVAGE